MWKVNTDNNDNDDDRHTADIFWPEELIWALRSSEIKIRIQAMILNDWSGINVTSIVLSFECNIFWHFFLTSDNRHVMVATFDFSNFRWKYYFAFCGRMSEIFMKNVGHIPLSIPSSLMLNSDKSVRAFGHEAEEQYHHISQEGNTDYYFFKQISRLYESAKVSFFLIRAIFLNFWSLTCFEFVFWSLISLLFSI